MPRIPLSQMLMLQFWIVMKYLPPPFLSRDAIPWGQRGKSAPPCPQRAGQNGQNSPSFAVYWFNFFTFSSYIRSSIWLDLLLSSEFHDLPWNATMVGSICLWKVTQKIKFWHHYDVIISASAFFQTSAPPARPLFRLLFLSLFCNGQVAYFRWNFPLSWLGRGWCSPKGSALLFRRGKVLPLVESNLSPKSYLSLRHQHIWRHIVLVSFCVASVV